MAEDKKFNKWWKENKTDPELNQSYKDYEEDCKTVGCDPMTYDDWGKEFFINFLS